MDIWPCSRIYHDPIYVKSAMFRAKMLTSTYILQINASKFNESGSSVCLLCNKENEDLPHFLCRCSALKRTRRNVKGHLARNLPNGQEMPTDDNILTRFILNGGNDHRTQSACSYYCFKLHIERDKIIKEILPIKKKKKAKKNIDPLNECLHCKKSIKVKDKAIPCIFCDYRQHIRCQNQKIMDGWKFNRITKGKESFSWICGNCRKIMIQM
jgi:hypothetical protein